ncbi:hypothetical protein OIU74_026956 [Salix koriyanagi]|uniref:Uncharacterized protein n=1 Tax=Salix koriyanagi TaxID=2511006 RepID=A0A9Q0W049_9ROSI|nr:hypothetical protein OIU74_026956 [Salix koriyanagi]
MIKLYLDLFPPFQSFSIQFLNIGSSVI